MSNSVDIGNQAEQLARHYLEKNGLCFVASNYRITGGEIDLIMIDADYLVFIEVKMRVSQDYGCILEIITPNKKQRIIRTAKHYLLTQDQTERVDCRFDVIGITQNPLQIEWIKNAFEVQY